MSRVREGPLQDRPASEGLPYLRGLALPHRACGGRLIHPPGDTPGAMAKSKPCREFKVRKFGVRATVVAHSRSEAEDAAYGVAIGARVRRGRRIIANTCKRRY